MRKEYTIVAVQVFNKTIPIDKPVILVTEHQRDLQVQGNAALTRVASELKIEPSQLQYQTIASRPIVLDEFVGYLGN